jgi:SAM-dependent methyltransferase
MDALKLNFPRATFDVVVSFDVIEHVPNPGRFVQQIREVLRPEGVLYIGTPNAKVSLTPGGRCKIHFQELTLDGFRELLSKCFLDVCFLGQGVTIDGRKLGSNWMKVLYQKIGLKNLVIVQDDVDDAFGLLAICRR